MNDIKKTGIFWGVAGLILAVALVVSQSGGTNSDSSDPGREKIGQSLFEDFKDPGLAASMKIVTFDEVQGQIGSFEVLKDPASGMWTIPSRDGYPADATTQMATAANALIDLQVLDVQTVNAEDHDDLGVVEPKIEDLEIGDEGVGRLVAFKDESRKTLASMIIGKPTDSDPSKIYVRIPGQNPVYVVRFDDTPLSTEFQLWIEEDLLQLSSIDVVQMEIKDYNASLGLQGFSWNRNFTATLIQEGTNWIVKNILDYNPRDANADPVEATISPTDIPNATKFNEMKDSLDDLKIVDVLRKPEGMSANLRADKELVSDQAAVESLSNRGFYPMQKTAGGEIDILSANGEMVVTLNDGVQYVLRFGKVSGVEGDSSDGETATGVNRYMLVTARVDETQFPLVGLQEIPQNLEDLDALLNPKTETPAADVAPEQSPADAEEAEAEPTEKPAADAEPEMTEPEVAGDKPAETEPAESASTETEPAKPADETPAEGKPAEEAASEEAAAVEEAVTEKTAVVEGEGSGSGSGGGQAADDESGADQAETETEPAEADVAAKEAPSDDEADDLTEEEKLELLAAEQEKIGKANQRLLDTRNDKIEIARRRVRELNARFADWYYVIPEQTYAKLRVKRSELFEGPATPAAAAPQGAPTGLPAFMQQGPGGN